MKLEAGQQFHVEIDPEFLEISLLPLNPVLNKLLASPDEATLTFVNPSGEAISCRLNRREGVIKGEGLGAFWPDPGSWVQITVLDPQAPRFLVESVPLVRWESTEVDPVDTNGLAVELDLSSVEELRERLVSAQFDPEVSVYLHDRARYLCLTPGFETLISLPVLRVEPFDYQRETARQVTQQMRGRALLCDEVGLGKTIEAGLILTEYMMRGLVNKALILTPPSLVRQWKEEMESKFNLDFVPYDSARFQGSRNGWETFDRVIASLYTAKREPHATKIEKIAYDLVIVDEAHHLKNRRTLNWRFVSRLKKKYILLLTATPVQNDLEELFNLITLLRPGQLETSRSFNKKYLTRGDRLRPRNTDELRRLLRGVMIRHKRSEVGVVLPPRHAEIIEVVPTEEETAFYGRVTNLVRDEYRRASGGGRSKGLNRFVLKLLQREAGSSLRAVVPTLRKLCDVESLPFPTREAFRELIDWAQAVEETTKARAVVQLLEGLGPDEKVLLFTGFRETQEYLAAILEEANISFTRFHGGLRRAKKEKAIDGFRDRARVLLSTESGGEGRNLQFSRMMINYDLPWNPMRIEQRIGRIHRIGQDREVYIYNLSASKTIEAHILWLLDAKINLFELVVGELDMILGNLRDRRDFEDIVMEIWARCLDERELESEMESFGEQLVVARRQYDRTQEYDDTLFTELFRRDPDGAGR
ncbi:MAG: DEAD/DEAH box helicase [Candidatus Bipolaricaulia bacterium]